MYCYDSFVIVLYISSSFFSISAGRKFFNDNGYLIFNPEIPVSIIDGALADLAGMYGHGTIHDTQRRVQHGWKSSANVKKIAVAPKILESLRELYGRYTVRLCRLRICRRSRVVHPCRGPLP